MQARKSLFHAVLLTAVAIAIPTLLFADHEEGRNRQRERHREGDHRSGDLKPVTNPAYKEQCGACHFSYQPELLPSRSWKKILAQLEDHFGQSFELDQEAQKAVLAYLESNAAERSNSKRAGKIVKSVGSSTPVRITEVPYIKDKHRKVSASVLSRPSIGALSNCTACHRRAEEGNYDDDFVVIPD
jgi:Dihaem cytochrome c